MTLDHEDIMTCLKSRFRFRDYEFDCLDGLVRPEFEESSPVIFAHGYKSVGKTLIVSEFLKQVQMPHTIVSCDQFLTQKILLQNILAQLIQDIGKEMPEDFSFINKGTAVASVFNTCDSVASFTNNLDLYLEAVNYDKTHTIVLDRIDQFLEQSHGIIAGLSRLNEVSSAKIIVLFISSLEEPIEAVTTSIPRIYFRPYTQTEIIEIFKQHRFCFFGSEIVDTSPAAVKFWGMYVQVMVDLFFPFTGPEVKLLADYCFNKWDTFIEPVIDGRYSIDDFMKVYNSNKDMFGNEALMTSMVEDYASMTKEEAGTTIKLEDLTYHSKFLLIAAYLASYVEPKNDLYFFSSVKTDSLKKRKFKRKQQRSQTLRNHVDIKLLSPNGFELERLFAIFLVIYRSDSKYFNDEGEYAELMSKHSDAELAGRAHEIANLSLAGNVDLGYQVAILESQGLLMRTATKDVLQAKLRWRCLVSFEDIQTIAQDVGFALENYMTD